MPGNTKSWLEHTSEWLHQHARWWLLFVALFFIWDIVRDVLDEEINAYLFIEMAVFSLCVMALAGEWRRNARLNSHLEKAQSMNQRLSGQFSDYVRERLAQWNLSRSEQEIAWLVLKGFSFTEIAALRSVQEKTVRQQATSIYAKSACRNRNEFIAHFIQDLLSGEHTASLSDTTNASARTPE